MGWTQVRRGWFTFWGIGLTGLALACTGCKGSSGDAEKDKSSKDDKDEDKDKKKKKKDKDEDEDDGGKDKPTKAGASSQPKTNNKGSFTYLVKPAVDPDDKIVEPLFTENKRIEAVIKAMSVFALPQDLPVLATDEGPCEKQLNAFYSSKAHGIFVCYPLVKAFYAAYLKSGAADADAADAALNAIVFVLMHEMGHALVGELGLGVTGKEEDAVDELAALILIQNKKPEWAVHGTEAMMAVFQTGDKPPFYDEHSVSEARFYDILCLIYGSDPSKYGAVVEKVPELKARALSGKCEKFYKSTDKAWTDMLAPHTRG